MSKIHQKSFTSASEKFVCFFFRTAAPKTESSKLALLKTVLAGHVTRLTNQSKGQRLIADHSSQISAKDSTVLHSAYGSNLVPREMS